jgi:hypothetical protein
MYSQNQNQNQDFSSALGELKELKRELCFLRYNFRGQAQFYSSAEGVVSDQNNSLVSCRDPNTITFVSHTPASGTYVFNIPGLQSTYTVQVTVNRLATPTYLPFTPTFTVSGTQLTVVTSCYEDGLTSGLDDMPFTVLIRAL